VCQRRGPDELVFAERRDPVEMAQGRMVVDLVVGQGGDVADGAQRRQIVDQRAHVRTSPVADEHDVRQSPRGGEDAHRAGRAEVDDDGDRGQGGAHR
jgi:hypothetical protein